MRLHVSCLDNMSISFGNEVRLLFGCHYCTAEVRQIRKTTNSHLDMSTEPMDYCQADSYTYSS